MADDQDAIAPPPAVTLEPAEATANSGSEELVALVEKYDVHLFRPSTYRFDPRTLRLPDDFFNTTLADVQQASSALSEQVQKMSEAPLMTKKMRQAEENARMAKFRKVLIRVLLPDRHSLQGVFTPKSTIRDLEDFVRACLKNPVKFHLFVVPPKTVLSNMRNSLWAERMVPAAQVYLGVDEGPTETHLLLSESVLTLAEDAPPPQNVATPVSDAAPRSAASAAAAADAAAARKKTKGKGKRAPKWFKRK